MNCKWFWILGFILIAGFNSLVDAKQNPNQGQYTCNVAPHRRRECGYAGILKPICEHRGCCFDNRIRGVKWCFHREISWKG